MAKAVASIIGGAIANALAFTSCKLQLKLLVVIVSQWKK